MRARSECGWREAGWSERVAERWRALASGGAEPESREHPTRMQETPPKKGKSLRLEPLPFLGAATCSARTLATEVPKIGSMLAAALRGRGGLAARAQMSSMRQEQPMRLALKLGACSWLAYKFASYALQYGPPPRSSTSLRAPETEHSVLL